MVVLGREHGEMLLDRLRLFRRRWLGFVFHFDLRLDLLLEVWKRLLDNGLSHCLHLLGNWLLLFDDRDDLLGSSHLLLDWSGINFSIVGRSWSGRLSFSLLFL